MTIMLLLLLLLLLIYYYYYYYYFIPLVVKISDVKVLIDGLKTVGHRQ